MNTTLLFNPPAIVREHEDLVMLAKTINNQHELGEFNVRKGLGHYRNAGEALIKAKKLVGHGNWLAWVDKNLKFNQRTAWRYMTVVKNWDKVQSAVNITEALAMLSAPSELPIAVKPNIIKEPVDTPSQPSKNIIEEEDPVLVPATEDGPQILTEEEAEEEAQEDDEINWADKETNWADKSCESIEWYTPRKLLDRVDAFFGGKIPLDPATTKSNRTNAARFFTKETEGLNQSWQGDGVFLNPPYGKELPNWTKKVYDETAKGVALVALLPCGARFSTDYWQDNILNQTLTALCFVKRRVAFVNEMGEPCKGNPYDSCIYGFNVDFDKFKAAFACLGKTLCIAQK